MTNNFSIGRNPMLSKAINWVALGTGGGLWFMNVHASSVAMKQIATGAVFGYNMPVAAGDDVAALSLRYISAFGVSLACLLISGAFLHPAGLPTVFRQIRNIEAKGGSKALGMGVTIGVAMLLLVFGAWAYYFDLMTTALAFGITSLWSLAAFPVWLNVVGPEFFFHATNWYGQLIGSEKSAPKMTGKAPTAASMPGRPPSAGAAMPPYGAGPFSLK